MRPPTTTEIRRTDNHVWFKKRHAEIIAPFDALDTRLRDLEFFISEAVRTNATEATAATDRAMADSRASVDSLKDVIGDQWQGRRKGLRHEHENVRAAHQ